MFGDGCAACMQVLLPAAQVHAQLPPDAGRVPLLRLHARDRHRRTWELLLRAWDPPGVAQPDEAPQLLLLEQAGGFLRDRGAKIGDRLVLSRPEDGGPLCMEVIANLVSLAVLLNACITTHEGASL